jgi:hypothetical protein
MKLQEFKELLLGSLNKDSDPRIVSRKIADEGIDFDFSEGFSDRVIDKIFSARVAVAETEFVRNLTSVFYRIALTGVAAIILLLISIFLMQGSISFDSFLGLGNNNEESIISFLTGN